MTIPNPTRPQSPRPGWPVPAALAALSAIPLIIGIMRLVQLAGGPELIAAEERFGTFPLPVVLHILGPPPTSSSAPSSSCPGSGAATAPGTAAPAGFSPSPACWSRHRRCG